MITISEKAAHHYRYSAATAHSEIVPTHPSDASKMQVQVQKPTYAVQADDPTLANAPVAHSQNHFEKWAVEAFANVGTDSLKKDIFVSLLIELLVGDRIAIVDMGVANHDAMIPAKTGRHVAMVPVEVVAHIAMDPVRVGAHIVMMAVKAPAKFLVTALLLQEIC